MTDEYDPISDDDLAELALAADPDAPLEPDAVELEGAWGRSGPLPLWYMPAPVARTGGPRRTAVVALIIAALLVVVASGFCVTYGIIEIA